TQPKSLADLCIHHVIRVDVECQCSAGNSAAGGSGVGCVVFDIRPLDPQWSGDSMLGRSLVEREMIVAIAAGNLEVRRQAPGDMADDSILLDFLRDVIDRDGRSAAEKIPSLR